MSLVTSSICYQYPSCTATEFYDPNTGFTNDTGWSNTDKNSCCQICLPGTPATVCFDEADADCASKDGNGDYDFILFDQIWRPQFCQSLQNEHDPTLTHTAGSLCEKNNESNSLLTIHGLWPNYFGGYPQCCNATGTSEALRPEEVVEWDIYPDLSRRWADPTDASSCSICLMLNHEWLKHGGCYSPGDPYQYFADALNLDTTLATYTSQINDLNNTIVLTSDIQKLYPAYVNVLCDPNDNSEPPYSTKWKIPAEGADTQEMGYFLEVQTCWSKEGFIDCAPASPGSITTPCPKYTYLRML